jgi:3-oxoacyl-[acyl-carrier-protein] synthase III
MNLRAKCAIARLGATRMGRNFDHSSAIGFAVEAVALALAGVGLERTAIDGLLVNPGMTMTRMTNPMASFDLGQGMELTDLSLTATMNLRRHENQV